LISKIYFQVDSIDINTSLSSLAQTTVSLDSVLRKCGDLGRFQLIHYFFINLIAMSAGIMGFYYVFGAAEPNHRCRLPENIWPNDIHYNPINKTHEMYLHNYIPKTKDGKTWESCIRDTTGRLNDTLVKCPNGWAYDRSIFGYTFTEEANFVCDRAEEKSWLATMMQCGGFSLLIIGSLADRYGRKKITAVITILLLVICLITQTLIQWLPMTLETKFALLLLNQFASGLTASTFSLIFILLLELTSSAHLSFAGNLVLVSFTIGEVIVTLFAYLAKNWQILKWANTAFVGLVIPYLYFMPESPLYLYSKRQYPQLEALLRRIATRNNQKEADWYPFYQAFIRNQPLKLSHDDQGTFCQKTHRILIHRPTVIKLLIIALLGFTTLMLYIRLSYGLAVMDISPYLGILIGAVVEAAGYITGSLLISTRLARKGSFILMMILTIICVVLIPILLKYSSAATVFIAQFGKYSISGAIAVSWIFVPELFPTSIRSSANGFFIAFSRIGAIVAPIINTAISVDYLPYASYASAGLAVIVVLLSLLLPETKDKSMEDVQDYAVDRSDA
jgi:MFS family permease